MSLGDEFPEGTGAAKRLGIWHKGGLMVSSRGVTDLLTDVWPWP